jgi:hypothetical protein
MHCTAETCCTAWLRWLCNGANGRHGPSVQIVRRPLKAAAKLLLGSKGGWTTPQAQPSYTKKDWEGV